MLQGQCAIVTGSTRGIGVGIARRLGASGVHSMLNGFGDAARIRGAAVPVDGAWLAQ